MTTILNPYLSFRDTARSAMQFYQSVFGGELNVNTFEEYHASEDPAEKDKLMHARLDGDDGLVLMASDTPNGMDLPSDSNVSLSLSGSDDAKLRGYWERLSDGGVVIMPLQKASWGDTFGMCVDRFGTKWMVNISA